MNDKKEATQADSLRQLVSRARSRVAEARTRLDELDMRLETLEGIVAKAESVAAVISAPKAVAASLERKRAPRARLAVELMAMRWAQGETYAALAAEDGRTPTRVAQLVKKYLGRLNHQFTVKGEPLPEWVRDPKTVRSRLPDGWLPDPVEAEKAAWAAERARLQDRGLTPNGAAVSN